eukprot:6180992-Pleurochrysis_carterae.AAC.1
MRTEDSQRQSHSIRQQLRACPEAARAPASASSPPGPSHPCPSPPRSMAHLMLLASTVGLAPHLGGSRLSALRMSSVGAASQSASGIAAPGADHNILLRAARGEAVDRTPVWLMRQAGRYMAEFREFSDKYPFRQRSETPDIAIELSLQPWRAFGALLLAKHQNVVSLSQL